VEGKSISQAGRDAGYGSPQSAWDAYQRLRADVVKALDLHDMFLDVAAKNLVEMCHATKTYFAQYQRKITDERPELLDQLRVLRRRVDHLHAKYLPTLYAYQRAVVKAAPEFRLGHSAYSSVYIVKHLRSGYHRDRQNLPGALSALLPLGDFSGGELVLPRWRIAFAFKPGDLLFFDPQQLHGNLPFRGKRLSAAFYCERRIAKCRKQ
jgi:hypothetical protein